MSIVWFDICWSRYPKRLGKKAAMRHFQATVSCADDFNRCIKAVEKYAAHVKANKINPKYIQHGSTFFNNWEDWVDYETEVDEEDYAATKQPVI